MHDEGEWEEVVPEERDSGVEEVYRTEFQAAMQQLAGFAITESARLSGGEVSVQFKGIGASPHDRLTIRDLQDYFDCKYSKAQRIMNSIPGSTKVGNKRVIPRSQLEAYLQENPEIKVDWNKGKSKRRKRSGGKNAGAGPS